MRHSQLWDRTVRGEGEKRGRDVGPNGQGNFELSIKLAEEWSSEGYDYRPPQYLETPIIEVGGILLRLDGFSRRFLRYETHSDVNWIMEIP